MKSQLKREERSKSINERNEHLLERIYKIFTRKRSTQKGFDSNGRPMRLPEYGECSLNRYVRLKDAEEINKRNYDIL